MTAEQTLSDILKSIQDTFPLERKPSLEFQITVLDRTRFVLWDARPDADEGIAAAVVSQLARILASSVNPYVGILAEADDAEEATGVLRAQYACAIGFQPDVSEPPPF